MNALAAIAPIRVLLADGHGRSREAVSRAVARVPGTQLVGEAAGAEDAARQAVLLQPDVILVDVQHPGSTAVGLMRASCPDARIFVLAPFDQVDVLTEALRAGADGYFVKNLDDELLAHSVQRALDFGANGFNGRRGNGGSHHLRDERGERTGIAPGVPRAALSPREREILRRVALGESNKEIGRALGVAESTVKIHVQHILRKLKLSSRVQAAVYAAEHGLVERQ
jgi:two-component system nitrate/nitrite response regulator NarL